MKYEEYIKPSEACQCILDFINSEDFNKAIAPEDRGAVMSGLGLAGTVIHARCPRYLAKFTLDEKEKSVTHGNHIRAMTDEELAEWMADHVDCGDACPAFHICRRTPVEDMECEDWLLKWLKLQGE